MPHAKTYVWKDPKRLTGAVVVLMAVDVVLAASGLLIQAFWGRQADYAEAPVTLWSGAQTVGYLHDLLGLCAILCVPIVVFWTLRVSKNAHVLKGRNLENSPMFAALWWWLIPLMSLFKPVQAMEEIWDASVADRRRAKQGRAILGVWWGATLAASGLGSLSYILQREPLVVALWLTATLVQSAAFALIVRRICALQIEKHTVGVFADDPSPPLGVLERLNS